MSDKDEGEDKTSLESFKEAWRKKDESIAPNRRDYSDFETLKMQRPKEWPDPMKNEEHNQDKE